MIAVRIWDTSANRATPRPNECREAILINEACLWQQERSDQRTVSLGVVKSETGLATLGRRYSAAPAKKGNSDQLKGVLSDENNNKTSQTRAVALIALRRRRRDLFERVCGRSLRDDV
ncbi:MAG: hypothetical protein DME50_12065 [Verrucomicrobia bacterium]|nr:MAG: hypothetical protein DME50_12065 [Verrucomicrobiota bacterium]